MYGAGQQLSGGTAAVPERSEGIGDINMEAIKVLSDNLMSIDKVLANLRGSQPSEKLGNEPKNIQRTVIQDAKVIRSISTEISYRLNELHQVLGYTK